MKTWLFLTLSCLFIHVAFSQDELPPYKKNKSIPAFELQLADNSTFTKANLKKGIPLIIIYFSPGCEHCQHQIEGMLKRTKDLQNYQILMATYQPIEELQDFNKKYHLKKYPNFVTGRDTKYFFPPFFQIQNFPHLVFYDKSGKFLNSAEEVMDVDKMLAYFK